MTLSDYPDIRQGTKWWEIRAAQWRRVMGDLGALQEISVGPGLHIERTENGLSISLALESIRPTSVRKRVAVLVVNSEPIDEETPALLSIHVREVRYRAKPPIEGEYEFTGPVFHAWPQVGTTLADFEAFELGDDPLAADTPILVAERKGDLWFVDVPSGGGGERLVIAKAFADDDAASRFLMVQEIKEKIEASEWLGEYETVGDVVRMPCWPTLTAGDFRPWLWRTDLLDDRMTVLPMGLHRGVWHVQQLPKLSVIRREGPVKRSADCGLFAP